MKRTWFNQFRFWLFKINQYVAYWICPPDDRRNFKTIWEARLDDYKAAIKEAESKGIINK